MTIYAGSDAGGLRPHGKIADEVQRTRVVFINNDTPGLARVLLSSRDALQRGIRHLADSGSRRLCYASHILRSSIPVRTAMDGLPEMNPLTHHPIPDLYNSFGSLLSIL